MRGRGKRKRAHSRGGAKERREGETEDEMEAMKSNNMRKRMGQERSCQGMIEKIKDGRVKTFSFIAGEGASQLARLSSTRALLFFQ